MARPFDASLKELIALYPADWLPMVGYSTTATVKVLDAEVSTISAAADKVLLVQDKSPWLLHLELQSGPKSDLGEQLHWYNSLLRHRYNKAVRSMVVLLRQTADSPKVTGTYQEHIGIEPPYLEFRFGVVRVWEHPVENLLNGGLGTLPLAPISAVPRTDLAQVVHRIDERLTREASREQAIVLGTASFILTGLRLSPDETRQLFQGAQFMNIVKDSSAYQIFLEEGMQMGLEEGMQMGLEKGRVEGLEKGRTEGLEKGLEKGRAEGAIEELRKTLLRQGTKRFGPPTETAIAAVNSVSNLEQLEQMSDRLLDAGSWLEMLGSS